MLCLTQFKIRYEVQNAIILIKYPKSSKYLQNHIKLPVRQESSDNDSESEDQAPCQNCKKMITMENDGIKCNFCEHWLCFLCSKLRRVVYQALRESQDIIFCDTVLRLLLYGLEPGVKKVMEYAYQQYLH